MRQRSLILLTQVAWFAGLWLAGIGALTLIAWLIRFALSA